MAVEAKITEETADHWTPRTEGDRLFNWRGEVATVGDYFASFRSEGSARAWAAANGITIVDEFRPKVTIAVEPDGLCTVYRGGEKVNYLGVSAERDWDYAVFAAVSEAQDFCRQHGLKVVEVRCG
jgi:hypothetical protein